MLTFTYSGSNLSTMQASDGTTTTFNYSGSNVTSIVTGNSRTTTLAYSSGNLTQVTNPDGGTPTFTYDGTHRMTGETFANLQDSWAYGSSGALGTMTWGSSGSPSATTYLPLLAQGLSAAARGPVIGAADRCLGQRDRVPVGRPGPALQADRGQRRRHDLEAGTQRLSDLDHRPGRPHHDLRVGQRPATPRK